MGKVIMVSDEIYNKLKMMKKPGESFTQVISRLITKKPRLMEIAGKKTITKNNWKKIKESFKERDKLDEVRRRYLTELIEK